MPFPLFAGCSSGASSKRTLLGVVGGGDLELDDDIGDGGAIDGGGRGTPVDGLTSGSAGRDGGAGRFGCC